MNQILLFLAEHGGAVLFVVVLAEQLGLPLPSLPWIVAAGALAADGRINLSTALAGIITACLIADVIWFKLGQHSGPRILGVLCRLSLQPDSCVRRTRNLFDHHGMRSVVVAKFVPGLSTIVPPLAGISGVRLRRFLLFDAIGSLLHGGIFLLVGVLFRHQLDRLLSGLARLGNWGLVLLTVAAMAYISFKFLQRRRLLRHSRVARIDADEVRRRQMAGESLTIFDLRSSAELERDPQVITGARRVDYDELKKHGHKLARDRDIIVYCSCPNEVSSASITLDLRRQGLSRVRPIIGGIDAWRNRHYPTEQWLASETAVLSPADPPISTPPSSYSSTDSTSLNVNGNMGATTKVP
jgi:membrane protein DedA with SNARE-associated domain/rhodanese-related sulfurtransferase